MGKNSRNAKKTAETVLGVTFGKRKGDRETWWWNEEVQENIKGKKEEKKAWDKIRDKNTKKIYKEMYFEKLMNEKNNRDPGTEEAEVVNEERQ